MLIIILNKETTNYELITNLQIDKLKKYKLGII